MTIKFKPLSFEDAINKTGNLCLYAFLFLTTYIFLFRYDHTMFLLRFGFLILGAMIGYVKCISGKRKLQQLPLFMVMVSIFWILSYLAQNEYENYSPSNFLYTICHIGICVLVLQNEYGHWISLCLYGITSVSILSSVIQGVNKDLILLANSRNYISILLLSTMLLYYISCHDKKKPILIMPVLIYFYINIYATGRGGIIVSGFLTIGLLVYKYMNVENKHLKRLMGFIIVIIVITVGAYIAVTDNCLIDNFLNKNFSGFFTKGMDSNGRNEIWSIFIQNNNKTFLGFLFGSDASIAMSDGNLHNSFLQSYASFGLLGFILIIAMIIRALREGIKQRDFLWIVLFAGLILRAATDRVFFQGYCELYLYYFLFYYDYHRMQDKKEWLFFRKGIV